jgi:hypothetical protein
VEAAPCTVAAGGGTASVAEQGRGAEGAQRKKMRGETVKDSSVNLKDLRASL